MNRTAKRRDDDDNSRAVAARIWSAADAIYAGRCPDLFRAGLADPANGPPGRY